MLILDPVSDVSLSSSANFPASADDIGCKGDIICKIQIILKAVRIVSTGLLAPIYDRLDHNQVLSGTALVKVGILVLAL